MHFKWSFILFVLYGRVHLKLRCVFSLLKTKRSQNSQRRAQSDIGGQARMGAFGGFAHRRPIQTGERALRFRRAIGTSECGVLF